MKSERDMAYARLIDENDALYEKIEKLNTFNTDRVSRRQAQLINLQHEIMRAYHSILQARIVAWDE